MASLFEEQEVHLRDYLYVVRKRRKPIGFFFLLMLLAALLLTFFGKVIYRAEATILIERENPNVVDFKEVMAFDASTTDYYQTQYQMLKSRTLIERLIEDQKLVEDSYLQGLKKGAIRGMIQSWEFSPAWLKELFEEPTWEDLFIRKMLQINPIRNSRLVQVRVLHPDPAKSAQMTNRLVDLFIQRNLESRFAISRQATELISNQLVDLKEKVAKAEQKLQDYKEEKNLVTIPSMREQDEFIQDAKLELVKIQAEESKLAKRYLPAHPKRIHIRSQIEGLQQKIEQEEQKKIELSRIAIEYSEFEREAESARRIYQSLLDRLEETHSEAQTQASNVLIVDSAETPERPYKPRPVLNLLIAIFLGCSGGVALAFFLEYCDPTIKIPDDIEKGLGLDLFGIIPEADKGQKGSPVEELFLTPGHASAVSESFRALRTALLFRLRQVPGSRVILVTSPNPEEGKSTVVLNLAQAFQQNHLKVLMVDADLRKSRLHSMFGFSREKGLTDVLEGEDSTEHAIHENVAGLGFDLLSCGSPSHHPTEILGTQKMNELLQRMRQTYDIILLDSPPFLPVADVAVLSEYVHAIIVVARYHRTDKRHLKGVAMRFNSTKTKVLGVVINHVSVREKDYYYHQYYYYGYGDAVPRR
jgi:capsular exopolysaccharide synthesis family protein